MNQRDSIKSLCLAIVLGAPASSSAQWSPVSIPTSAYIGGILTHELSFQQNYVFVGTDAALCISSDGGSTWSRPTGNGMDSLAVIRALVVKDSLLFAGTASDGVYRSSDHGSTWQSCNSGLPIGDKMSFTVGDSGIFVGTYHGVYYSTNSGDSWMPRNSGMSNYYITTLAYRGNSSGGHRLYAGAVFGRGLHKSTDNGLTWNLMSQGWADSSVSEVRIGNDSTVYAATGAGINVSSDDGSTWTQLGLTDKLVVQFIVNPEQRGDQNILAGTQLSGFYYSWDGGETWTSANEGLPVNRQINAIACNSQHVFIGLHSGTFWRRDLDQVVLTDVEDREQIQEFRLEQNYPNPFNPSTTIRYDLPEVSHVTLEIFNLIGERVAILVDEFQGPGVRSVQFHARNLPSGVYVCRLQAGGYSDSKIILLMR